MILRATASDVVAKRYALVGTFTSKIYSLAVAIIFSLM